MGNKKKDSQPDQEYIDQLKAMEPKTQEEETYMTVAEHDPALAQQLVEATKNEIEAKKARTRTYITSEIPVRPCTEDCPKRNSCKDFLFGRVVDRDLCKPELRKIKKWQKAFRDGDLEKLKDDVGTVAGGMAVQLMRLLEAVNQDGVVVESERVVAGGYKYTELVTHPALMAASKISKDLGIDLTNYLMTPKSQKENGPSVQVNIGISADEVHSRFAARFAPKEVEEVGEGDST